MRSRVPLSTTIQIAFMLSLLVITGSMWFGLYQRLAAHDARAAVAQRELEACLSDRARQ